MAQENKHGIKETKEVIKLAFVLAGVIAGEMHDGFQFVDLLSVFNKMQGDGARKAIVDAALENISLVPDEVNDVTFAEGLELAVFAAQEVPALLEALSSKKA